MSTLRCRIFVPVLLGLALLFGPVDRARGGGVSIPEMPKFFLGSCGGGPNAPGCAWDCDAESATCGGGASCTLDVAEIVTGHLFIRATDCTGGGARMEVRLAAMKRDGTPLPVIQQSFDYCTARVSCGTCECPVGGFGQCPPVPGFFCTFDGQAFSESAFVDPGTGIGRWMIDQVLPESVRSELAAAFPDAKGPALVVQNALLSPPVDHSGGDPDPSDASMCVTIWLLRENRALPVPADIAAAAGGSSALSVSPAVCPRLCGNGQVDPGEQCDVGADGACPGRCGAPGSAGECECGGEAAPRCDQAHASPDRLLPANAKHVPVAIEGVVDPDGDPVTIAITAVRQDEPTVDSRRRNAGPEAEIRPDGTALLRADRTRDGDGRVYHLAFTASDGDGHRCAGTATVCVPLKPQATCGDQGALFDSTQ